MHTLKALAPSTVPLNRPGYWACSTCGCHIEDRWPFCHNCKEPRKLKRTILGALAAAILFTASQTFAQFIGPINTSHKIAWDAIPGLTAVEAQPLVYKLFDSKDNLPPAGPIQLSNVICTTIGSTYGCQAPVTQVIADLVNKVGQHAITLTVTHPTGGESVPSLPFSFRVPPAAPTGLRITP